MPFVDLSSPQSNNDDQIDQAQNQENQSVSISEKDSPIQGNPPIQEEHNLMREVPENITEGSSDENDNGVKEIKGPPLPGQEAVEQVAATPEEQPVAQAAPQPAAGDVQDANSDNVINESLPGSTPEAQVESSQQPANLGLPNDLAGVAIDDSVETPIVEPAVAAVPNMESETNTATSTELPELPKEAAQTAEAAPVASEPAAPERDIELQGSAVDQAEKVNEIMAGADEALASQQQPQPTTELPSLNSPTADEKFIAEKATLAELLSIAEKRDASDLHLSVGYPPILRINGKLINLGGPDLTDDRIKHLLAAAMTEQDVKDLEKQLDVDFSYTHTTGTRFRVNIYHKKGSLAGAFRLIPSRIRTVAELGLPEVLYELLQIPQGLIILAGPTGSGKSTTIASMVQEINMNQPKHIITLEDPIEYLFPRGKALVNQREIGTDVLSFERGLREVLREDPDVVFVGEMRDYEAISSTITTAETGHLVFSTLHTNSASQTVDRMIDVFPDAQQAQIRAQLANVISAVISQRLVPVKSGGRRAVLEIMIATPAIRNAIREAKTYQIDNMIQTNSEIGMITLEKSLINLIRSGELTLDEAQTYTTKPDELISLMKNN